MDENTANALAQARGAQAVLMGLLHVLKANGQIELIEKTFEIAGETFVVASMSKDEALRAQATAVLQVIDHMRQTLVGHQSPKQDI
ncbi:hypothetical protein Q669_22100 [Labrenzia sp. C1B10]|uniref:hypothetical protein n=1 Tax=unclassified Labrenzia TaxID=2648686 RepID=UPI0003B84D73|nr:MULTISPECIES: hypothetical protein [unclassified Labrenzia]ERP97897.1 hypothetical protein Q669_22100 [Labrenzia sp. C1B10]ERS01689.1 hypothetical protein Q675_06215 [Labrenzia sp. C1B70]